MAEDKNVYEQKYQAKLDEWNAEIDKLAAKARQADADARIEYEKQIQTLRDYRRDAEQRLNELRKSGEDAWRDVREGAEKAGDEMERALKKALVRFH